MILTVEDHYPEGGIGGAVSLAGFGIMPAHILAVRKIPKSGSSGQLLEYKGIGQDAIIKIVKAIIR